MSEIILTENEKLYIRNQVKINDFEKQIKDVKNEKEALLIEKDKEKIIIEADKETEIQGIQKKIDKLK